jgi:hypothetical protein
MFGLTIFTFLVHVSLNEALGPLLYNLPRTLAVEELYRGMVFEALPEPEPATTSAGNPDALPDGADAILPDTGPLPDPDQDDDEDEGYEEGPSPSTNPETTRSGISTKDIEGVRPLTRLTFTFLRQSLTSYLSPILSPFLHPLSSLLTPYISPPTHTSTSPPPNFMQKYLHPEIFCDYHLLRSQIPDSLENFDLRYKDEEVRDVYFHPCVGKENDLTLWIPKDKGRVSRQEVVHTGKVIGVSDVGVLLDDKGNVVVEDWQQGVSPVLRKRVRF